MSADSVEQQDEGLALLSIFDPEEFVRNEPKSSGEFRLRAELPAHFTVSFKQGERLSQYEVLSLPPLCLSFELPEDYPSCSAPSFTLRCSWLTPMQLSSLGEQLAQLYQSTRGEVVLFSWAQFLKYESLGFLGISDSLDINQSTSHLDTSANANSNEGASSVAVLDDNICLSLSPGQALLSCLLVHDAEQRERAFSREQFACGVCFESWLGSKCQQVAGCGHIFCRSCLAEFCKVQIESGNVREVTCVQAECKSTLTPAQVRTLVGEELFSRYDRLLLQYTLDSMPDVVYCPRPSCASAVLSSGSMAQCSACSLAFCLLCQRTYHGTGACPTAVQRPRPTVVQDGDLAEIPDTLEGRRALWEDYSSASKPRRNLLEERYGRETMVGFLSSCLSLDWIDVNSKNCPHCFIRIQKDGGCNHMTCSRCRRHFCWKCLTLSPAPDHFRETCPLYLYP
ncbi:unnamed protein product [Knipowitschia caucasica]|uniref:RBR-type E3 ubiquitin transferase n=1 Tax=Knipowitschia caucasica TaxID=637954 RepID=A0AAV2KUR6_KNICA